MKMKIIIILKKIEGGVGRYVSEVTNILEQKGHEVKIISREKDLHCFSMLKSIFKIRKLVKKEKFDIVYTNDWSITLPLLFPFPIYSEKHFSCFHGMESSKLSDIIQKIIGKLMGNKLVVVGDQLKEKFPNANLIYEGINMQQFYPIKKIKRIKNSVGFANYRNNIYNYDDIKRATNNSNKYLHVAEFIPKDKMNEFYNKLDTFISLPPSYTGFGLCVMEAMAAGVTKIITNNYGINLKLPTTKIENYQDIQHALMKCKNNDYRKWLIENKSLFSWEKHSEKLLNIFRENKK